MRRVCFLTTQNTNSQESETKEQLTKRKNDEFVTQSTQERTMEPMTEMARFSN
jgi:hypothetical protein